MRLEFHRVQPLKPAHGFDLHTGRRISAQDRKGLERLCRYIMRPPLSHDRISFTDDGRVCLRLKRAWSDGTSHLFFYQRIAWARVIQRLFGANSLTWDVCGRQMRIVGVVMNAQTIRAVLKARGMDSGLPTAHQALAAPQMELCFEKRRDAA